MLKEFRDFAARGNVIDLAVGVIIGAAFGKVVTSAGQRPHHAADRHGPRPGGFRQPVRGAERRHVCIARFKPRLQGPRHSTTESFSIPASSSSSLRSRCSCWSSRFNRLKGPVVIDTRDCPFCVSKMALKATRCPACTSEVKPAA